MLRCLARTRPEEPLALSILAPCPEAGTAAMFLSGSARYNLGHCWAPVQPRLRPRLSKMMH